MADSSSSLYDKRESKSQSKSEQHVTEQRPYQPVTVYRQDEVTPRRREQPEPSSKRRDDADDEKPKPRSEAVVVSRVESKTPRDKLTLEEIQAQLPDRSDGSRNVRPG